MKTFFVNLTTNRSRVVLSTSVTHYLERYVCEHTGGTVNGFIKPSKLASLVYY